MPPYETDETRRQLWTEVRLIGRGTNGDESGDNLTSRIDDDALCGLHVKLVRNDISSALRVLHI